MPKGNAVEPKRTNPQKKSNGQVQCQKKTVEMWRDCETRKTPKRYGKKEEKKKRRKKSRGRSRLQHFGGL